MTHEPERLVAGRYRLLSRVGEGGMGVVWRARDEVLGRVVAVKEVLLPAMLSDAERQTAYQRTLREARSAARLSHPGVVTVHDVVEEHERPWIIMELVDARSLQQIIDQDGPLPPARATGIGRQLVVALDAAHTLGVLHRDVKPSNVLLGEGDRVVLTDFGIARIEGETALTKSGLLIGTVNYMAPERVEGEPAIPASDLWGLGATLYAAVEGRPPFDHADVVAVLTKEPPPPVNAGSLRPVLEGLLRRDPGRRLTALTAGVLLDKVAGGHATAAAPVPEPALVLPVSDNHLVREPAGPSLGEASAPTLVQPGVAAAEPDQARPSLLTFDRAGLSAFASAGLAMAFAAFAVGFIGYAHRKLSILSLETWWFWAMLSTALLAVTQIAVVIAVSACMRPSRPGLSRAALIVGLVGVAAALAGVADEYKIMGLPQKDWFQSATTLGGVIGLWLLLAALLLWRESRIVAGAAVVAAVGRVSLAVLLAARDLADLGDDIPSQMVTLTLVTAIPYAAWAIWTGRWLRSARPRPWSPR